MSKVLFITNLASSIGAFTISAVNAAHSLNYDFCVAVNRTEGSEENIRADEKKHNIKIFNLPISRNPFAVTNIKAYKELVKIVNREKIDCIHCNTPTGGLLGRLVGKKCGVKSVIYQAHGFHFYKGAPKKNWLIYYPVEKWLAHYTDAIITINSEDCELAKKKFRLRDGGKVYFVPGVGIDTSQYGVDETRREEKRTELNLGDNDVALISMGDLIERKNYDTAIRAVAKANNPALQYFICGRGPQEEKLKTLAESLGVSAQIHFLGFRSDIKELLSATDIFLFTTKQEGLPRSMMEAMASGLPCVASKIRGNTDLLEGANGGFLCETNDISAYAEAINLLANDKAMRRAMGSNNLTAIQKFGFETATDAIRKVYDAEFAGGGVSLERLFETIEDFYPLRTKKRAELKIPNDACVMISVGELNANKNNGVVISAMAKLKNPNIHYILCGIGEKQAELQAQADSAGLHDRAHFLGYRTDVKELFGAADIFLLPSFREGLSRSLMEAMASGLPCVVSRIRGNSDLTEENGGFLCDPKSSDEFSAAMEKLAGDRELSAAMGDFNRKKIKKFDFSVVVECMTDIYRKEISEKV